MKILIVDNNDSFTNNLEHLLFECAEAAPVILPYDSLAVADLAGFDLLVISPGPCTPADYPSYGPLFETGTPVLGICLGMQVINDHYGGRTVPLPGCVHGRAESIDFEGARRRVARYHSLHIERLGEGLEVISHNDAGVIMALRHRTLPIIGYQFHPESFLTDGGCYFIDYALRLFGLDPARRLSSSGDQAR